MSIFTNDDIVFSYSRADALADKQQYDISIIAENVGFKYPVFITDSVNSIIEEHLQYCNDRDGILWDLLNVLYFTILQYKKQKLPCLGPIKFKISIFGKRNQSKDYSFIAEVGPYDLDDPKPAFTIMTSQDV